MSSGDYDQLDAFDEPSIAIKTKFYQQYIKPLLTHEPAPINYIGLFEQGYIAWKLGIGMEDLRVVHHVSAICNIIMRKNAQHGIELMSQMLKEQYDTSFRRKCGERIYHDYRDAENEDGARVAAILNIYKVLFENDFRLWSSIPYYYAHCLLNQQSAPDSPSDVVHIAASNKLRFIHTNKIRCPYGDLGLTIQGFDSSIRNAGGGHEDWEVSDDRIILFKERYPKTGKEKNIFTLKLAELEHQLGNCRKTIWLLRMGFTVYLNNNPVVLAKLDVQKKYKLAEVIANLEAFAVDRCLAVTKLSFNDDETKLVLVIRYKPNTDARGGTVLFQNGEKYDLIRYVNRVSYREQIAGLIQFLLTHYSPDNLSTVKVEVHDEDDIQIGNATYEESGLRQLSIGPSRGCVPDPTAGSLPTGKYAMIIEVPVQHGMRKIVESDWAKQGREILKELGD
jgi:hypothetical protein